MPKTAMIPTDWTSVETSIEDTSHDVAEFYHDPDSPMSKTEEKALFLRIVETLPDGYLRDILRGIEIEVCRAIDNDFGVIMPQLEEQRAALTAEIAELKRQRDAWQSTCEKLANDYRAAIRQIREAQTLKSELQRVVQSIRDI